MSPIHGCVLEMLNHETCEAIFDWVAGGAAPSGCDHGFRWLLAHCRDGVTGGTRMAPRGVCPQCRFWTSARPFRWTTSWGCAFSGKKERC